MRPVLQSINWDTRQIHWTNGTTSSIPKYVNGEAVTPQYASLGRLIDTMANNYESQMAIGSAVSHAIERGYLKPDEDGVIRTKTISVGWSGKTSTVQVFPTDGKPFTVVTRPDGGRRITSQQTA